MTPFETFGEHAGASSPWSFGPGRGMPAPCLQRGRVHREPSVSCDQFLVGDAALGGCGDQVIQALEGVALHVALVQAESELAHVPAKVLFAGVVIDAMQAALEDRPQAFDAVGVYVVPDVLARAVVDRGALEEQPAKALIGRAFVAVDRAARLNVLVDRPVQRGDIHVPDMQGDGAPSTFTHPEDGGFSHGTPPALQALGLVLGSFLAADVRLVNLNDAAQHLQVRAARLAQPPEDEPCGLLRDADFLAELERADALTRGDEQVHRVEPLVQGNMGPLEDGPGPDGEVLFAGVAAVEAAFADGDPVTLGADRADRPLRPAARFQVHTRGLLIREHLEKLEGADGEFVVHDSLHLRRFDKLLLALAQVGHERVLLGSFGLDQFFKVNAGRFFVLKGGSQAIALDSRSGKLGAHVAYPDGQFGNLCVQSNPRKGIADNALDKVTAPRLRALLPLALEDGRVVLQHFGRFDEFGGDCAQSLGVVGHVIALRASVRGCAALRRSGSSQRPRESLSSRDHAPILRRLIAGRPRGRTETPLLRAGVHALPPIRRALSMPSQRRSWLRLAVPQAWRSSRRPVALAVGQLVPPHWRAVIRSQADAQNQPAPLLARRLGLLRKTRRHQCGGWRYWFQSAFGAPLCGVLPAVSPDLYDGPVADSWLADRNGPAVLAFDGKAVAVFVCLGFPRCDEKGVKLRVSRALVGNGERVVVRLAVNVLVAALFVVRASRHGQFSYWIEGTTVYVIPLIPVGVKYIIPIRNGLSLMAP